MAIILNLSLELPEDFVPAEAYPKRGPIALAEALRPFVKDKVYCDLGCGAGDVAELLVPYAKKVYGVEIVNRRALARKTRNFELLQGDLWELMPEADVYYNWVSVEMIKKLAEFFQERPETLIIGGQKDAEHVHHVVENHNAEIYEFAHNERAKKDTEKWNRPWWIAVMK